MAKPRRSSPGFSLSASLKHALALSQGINQFADAVRNVAAFLTALGSTFVAIFGTGISTGALSLPSLPLAEAAFPIRFVLFIVVAAGLGWALGSLVGLCDRLPQELQPILASLLAVLFAGLVAGTADWLVDTRSNRTAIPQALIMTLIGTGIALRTSAYQFESGNRRRDRLSIRRRANVMLIFAFASSAIVVLSELGVR